MSDNQVSKLCPVCGATARPRASFCPKCGQPLHTVVPEVLPVAPSPSPTEAEIAPMDPGPFVQASVEVAPTVFGSGILGLNHPQAAEPIPSRRGIAEVAIDAVEESLKPGVEKLRHVSHAVLDEAAVDPSARFVLVAVALFMLFIVFLLISLIK